MYEASRAVEEGGKEIDMVVNVGRVLSGKWEYVKGEIEKVNKAVTERGAILKVIFENDCEFQLLSEWRKEEKLMRIRSGREGDHQAL